MTAMIVSPNPAGGTPPQLLRLDTRDRVRTSRERRGALLGEYHRSGVSAARFAQMAGVNYQTFAGWLHGRGRAVMESGPPARRKKSVQWIELGTPAGGAASLPLRVQLPGGASIEISAPGQLPAAAALLRVSWPRPAEAGKVKMQLAPEAFTPLTDGIALHGAKPRG